MTCIDHGLKGNYQGYAERWCRETGKKEKAHRLAFFRANGCWPKVVMHTCDNPRCVNPEHLVAGDWGANNRDRADKGRSAKIRLDLRKLNDQQADEIRRRFALRTNRDKVNGVSALAREFGVDTNVIYNIAYGRSHFHKDTA
jgi:hypothetical protein